MFLSSYLDAPMRLLFTKGTKKLFGEIACCISNFLQLIQYTAQTINYLLCDTAKLYYYLLDFTSDEYKV